MRPTIRASELDRTLACNGSIVISELVDKRQGDEGAEGSALHSWSAFRLMDEFKASGEFDNDDANRSYRQFKHSEWIANFYVRHVTETVPAEWSLEVEAAMAYEFPRFILSGHIDCVAISPDATEAIGFDLKTGRVPVDIAESNEQIFGYACLLKRAYPTLKKVTFWIVQPRNDEDEGYPRKSFATLEGERLENALPTLETRINAALDNQDELSTGPQCKFCVGCSCPAIREEQKLMKMKLTKEAIEGISRTPSDALLGDFVATGRLLAKPLEDATELLHARLDQTDAIVAGNGTTITRKIVKGGYEITQPVEFFTLAKSLLVTDAHMAAVYKPSMTRLGDELAEVLGIPRTGNAPMTGQSVLDAQFKTFTTQKERRLLQFK